jgi:ABC-type nitrate/sulfonate/bicarbonate transport system substrate-binding protein
MRKLLNVCVAGLVALSVAVLPGAARADDTAKAAQPATVLKFFSNHGWATAYELAGALGWLKEKGIEIKSVGFAEGGPESIFGLNTGSVDLADCATAGLINAVAAGSPIIGVMPNIGVDETTNSKFFVLADSPIKTANDLKGKSIAVNSLGAHLDYAVRVYLKAHGMKSSDVQLVVVPGPQLNQILRHKQADVVAAGAVWQDTFAGQIEAAGGVRVLFNDYEVLGSIGLGNTIMSKSFVEKHPQLVKDFVTASAKAADWANAHLDQARQLLAEILKNRGDNPELAKYWNGFGLRPHALYVDRDAQFWIDALVGEGKLKPGQLTPAAVVTNTYNDLAAPSQN